MKKFSKLSIYQKKISEPGKTENIGMVTEKQNISGDICSLFYLLFYIL
jgi:hypothetical protein